uniref:peptidylprolyl isomerase n=1 Tax=Rhizochromulina marina TaxID=1034831 RepID=A0A7S2REJ1_9STRA
MTEAGAENGDGAGAGEGQELMPGVTLHVLERRSEPESFAEYGGRVAFKLSCHDRADGLELFADQALSVRLGDGDVVPGVELALRYLGPGDRARVCCAHRFAFGLSGRPAKHEGERAIAAEQDVDFIVAVSTVDPNTPVAGMALDERLREADCKRQSGNIFFLYEDWARATRCYAAALKALEGAENEEDAAEPDTAGHIHSLLVDCGNNLALAHLRLDDPKKAEDACIAVLSLDPANVKALYRAGVATKLMGRYDEARLALDRALELDPSNKAVVKELRNLQAKRLEYRQKDARIAQAMGAKLFAKQEEGVVNTPPSIQGERARALSQSPASAPTTQPKETSGSDRVPMEEVASTNSKPLHKRQLASSFAVIGALALLGAAMAWFATVAWGPDVTWGEWW